MTEKLHRHINYTVEVSEHANEDQDRSPAILVKKMINLLWLTTRLS